MNAHEVSIVIVTYNSAMFIDRCLAPIYGVKGIQIVVVDNSSTDNTAEHITENYPDLKFIRSSSNLGFAGGNNLGFKHCQHRHILLLNPDVFLDNADQIFQLAMRLSENPAIAMAGPKLRNVDGSHQTGDAGWRDSLTSTAGHMLLIHKLFARWPSLYITNPRLLRKDFVEVDWICGACLITRKDVIESIGGMDESIFMYGEDVEWGERARDRGYSVLYCPTLSVLHLQGATQRKNTEVFYSTKWIDNRARKWKEISHSKFVLFKWLCLAGFSLRLAISLAMRAFGKNTNPSAGVPIMRQYISHVSRWQ